jgi:hypothetical protein
MLEEKGTSALERERLQRVEAETLRRMGTDAYGCDSGPVRRRSGFIEQIRRSVEKRRAKFARVAEACFSAPKPRASWVLPTASANRGLFAE